MPNMEISNQDSTCIEDVVTGMIKYDHAKIFPLTFKLCQIALVLPITTASVERSFSSFKYIKNRLRSNMGDERMEHLTCFIFIKQSNLISMQLLTNLSFKEKEDWIYKLIYSDP